MSSDDTPDAPTGDDSSSAEVTPTGGVPTAPDRREAVREKAQLVQAKQSRARMVRTSALIAGVVAAVAVIAVVLTWTIGGAVNRPQLSPDKTEQDGFVVSSISGAAGATSPDDLTTPDATATAEGDPQPTPSASATTSAPVEIHVYVDYLSPSAREWQLANAAQLSSWVTQGAATLTYHPVAMLTAKSNGTKYSLRAANAAACVATYAPASFFDFNGDLLTRQPAADSDGFSDKELADLAQANGVDDPKQIRECIESASFSSWVKAATERAVAGETAPALTGTSMITVNGQAYVGEMTDPAEFSQFVLTSASGAAAKAQSSTPTATPSPTTTP
ncbi:MAG TPA: thioredoxin domain-containing protein [Microbacterium sp.]|nr:thioredoxin domain-containing protein [Microbacterium sp.]